MRSDNLVLNYIDEIIRKIEKENHELELKIKDAHVEHASLQEDLRNLIPAPFYKFRKLINIFY